MEHCDRLLEIISKSQSHNDELINQNLRLLDLVKSYREMTFLERLVFLFYGLKSNPK